MAILTLDPSQENFQEKAIKAFEEGFKHGIKNKRETAAEMLSQLFQLYAFDLQSFITELQLSPKEKDRFLSYILYEIYYSPPFFPALRTQSIHDILWVLVAETLKKPVLEKKLLKLDSSALLSLIRHCDLNLREGAWFILRLLEEKMPWTPLLQGIRIKYYDSKLLEGIQDISTALIVLESDAEKQIRQIKEILPKLVGSVVDSPLKGFDIIEEMKKKVNPLYVPDQNVEQMRQWCQQIGNDFATTFEKFNVFSLSFEQLRQFFQLFGLRGYFIDYPVTQGATSSLLELLEGIDKLLQNPVVIPKIDLDELILFFRSLCQHLHVFFHEPAKYANGIKRIVYAVGTNKSDFPVYAWLPTVLEGLFNMVEYFHHNGLSTAALSDYPILIFDQNEGKVFQQNAAYVNHLANQFSASIWHLSKQQTKELALKLDVEHWIETTPEKEYGYGGVRNCQFFLAPVIHRAMQKGCLSWEALMQLSQPELTALFDEAVLGKGGADAIVNLGEDDAAVHPCNCFIDALTAEFGHEHYFMRYYFCKGRYTMLLPNDMRVEKIDALFEKMFPVWLDIPTGGGMKGMLSKPKFCFPLPYGNEELHVRLPHTWIEIFNQPMIHLSGIRYPKKMFPVSPLEGIAEKFISFFPYTFQIFLVSELIDSINKMGRSICSWNKHPDEMQLFHNFDDLQRYVFAQGTQQEFRRRFWRNLDDLFGPPSEEFPLKTMIDHYCHQEIPKDIPFSLKKYYRRMKEGARMFCDFGTLLRKYHAVDEGDFVEEAREDVEKMYGKKVLDSLMVRDLYLMVKFIESFKDGLYRGKSGEKHDL